MSQAQPVLRSFVITADQMVPPTATSSSGRGQAQFIDQPSGLTIGMEHDVADPLSVTIRNANFGSNGPVLFTFADPASPVTETWALSAADVLEFEAGRLYVQIESASDPNDRIRGQIALNPDPQPGDVIISEIMYNPASLEGDFSLGIFTSHPEWIELYNTTFTDINVGGWFFQDEDVETNGPLACELQQSGSFPDYVLRAQGVVVVIPDGTTLLPVLPSVEDFKASWGLTEQAQIIQLNTNGTTGGAIVGFNLSNNPESDQDDENDLPLESILWFDEDCNTDGFLPRPDNEVLTLNNGTEVIDWVSFDDDFTGGFPTPWPAVSNMESITVVPADYPGDEDLSTYTEAANNLGENWIAHANGDDAGGFQQVSSNGVYGGSDVGSPGRLLGVTIGNQAPVAVSATILTGPNETTDILLNGNDQTTPFFGLLLYIIKTIPQHGQLIDVPSNKVITQSDLSGLGYLMPRMPFNHVRYVNTSGGCQNDSFTFSTHDAQIESGIATIGLTLQCGEVMITEIMYNPDSSEFPPPAITEWVELYNTTDAPIDLAGWHLRDEIGRGGDFPSYILGSRSTVVVVPAAGDPAEFDTAWNAPYIHTTTNGQQFTGAIAGSGLRNSPGEDLLLMHPDGLTVADGVYFRNGFDDPAWPAISPDGPSLYMRPPGIPAGTDYTAIDNDAPTKWDQSFNGFEGAYVVSNTAIYDGVDIGSPGYLHGVIQGDCADGGPLADGNGDGVIDMADFEHLTLCLNGPFASLPSNCLCFDSDSDGDVDLFDLYGTQGDFSTP